MASGGRKFIRIADYAKFSINPLRKITQEQNIDPNPSKKVITLQLGDPTKFGNFPPPKELMTAIKKAVDGDKFQYNISFGSENARQAIAKYEQHQGKITADDVIVTSGCSAAMEMCVLTLVSPGENLLIPRPCYNYKTWTDGMHIETRPYNLNPVRDWDVDLDHMESLIDENTRAIVITNPGNPCGNVFSKEHMLDILAVAERYRLPIIADEIYEHFAFPGIEFNSFSSVSKNVPILSCSGLSKRFLVPGIRLGWIVIHDRDDALTNVKQGLRNVTGRILGPNSTVQQALPDILHNVPQEFFDGTMKQIARHASKAFNMFNEIPGLNPIRPRGAMYMMIKIELEKFPEFSSCLEFSQGLIREQSVLLFPGFPCFNYPGYFRIVLTVPEEMIVEACVRIKEFCAKHIQSIN